jgi:hypothetical protein
MMVVETDEPTTDGKYLKVSINPSTGTDKYIKLYRNEYHSVFSGKPSK